MSNGINNNGKSGNLLWKLLRKHVSAVQMAGFSLASLVGLVIVLLALQFYIDIKPVFASDDSFMRTGLCAPICSMSRCLMNLSTNCLLTGDSTRRMGKCR